MTVREGPRSVKRIFKWKWVVSSLLIHNGLSYRIICCINTAYLASRRLFNARNDYSFRGNRTTLLNEIIQLGKTSLQLMGKFWSFLSGTNRWVYHCNDQFKIIKFTGSPRLHRPNRISGLSLSFLKSKKCVWKGLLEWLWNKIIWN